MRFRKLFILLIPIFLTGCVYYGEFAYLPNYRYIHQNEVKPLKIAILPFKDNRGHENKDQMTLAVIPLVPYGPIKYERVEKGTSFFGHESFKFNPSVDIPRALVCEINANNVFENVFYSSKKDSLDVDYLIYGEINDLTYKGKFLTYGLAGVGASLLITGIPAGIINNFVNIKITVYDVRQKKTMFDYKIEGKTKLVVGMYYKMMEEFSGYSEILNDGFKDFVLKLNDELN